MKTTENTSIAAIIVSLFLFLLLYVTTIVGAIGEGGSGVILVMICEILDFVIAGAAIASIAIYCKNLYFKPAICGFVSAGS